MNTNYDLDRITTRLPPIQRSPSPAFLSTMKDLVPSPLRKVSPVSSPYVSPLTSSPDSPSVGTKAERLLSRTKSEEREKPRRKSSSSTPPKSTSVKPRSVWASFPQGHSARSRSPVPHDKPLPARSRSPLRDPLPRYNYVSPEDEQIPRVSQVDLPEDFEDVPTPRSFHPARTANQPPGRQERCLDGLRPGMVPGPEFGIVSGRASQTPSIARSSATLSVASTSSLVPKPLSPRKHTSSTSSSRGSRGSASSSQLHRHVPSMCEYLSLEQLENLWQAEDMYNCTTTTMLAPQKEQPFSPMFRLAEEDPRSPILPIHPAFRNDPPSYCSTYI